MDTSDLPTAVAEYLAQDRTDLFGFAETLVGHDTQNPPGGTVDIVEWLETTLKEPALSVERFEVDPESPNLIATVPGQTDRMLCFSGHLDTVPFDEGVYRRSATGGGDTKMLRREGIPTVEFGFGTQTAHGTDEYTTTEAPVRNAISYGTLPVLCEQLTSTDR